MMHGKTNIKLGNDVDCLSPVLIIKAWREGFNFTALLML
jgi:hypothetical protein